MMHRQCVAIHNHYQLYISTQPLGITGHVCVAITYTASPRYRGPFCPHEKEEREHRWSTLQHSVSALISTVNRQEHRAVVLVRVDVHTCTTLLAVKIRNPPA